MRFHHTGNGSIMVATETDGSEVTVAHSSKRVYVTAAQKQTAQGLIERSAKTGRHLSTSVAKIANASRVDGQGPRTSRGASAGRDTTRSSGEQPAPAAAAAAETS